VPGVRAARHARRARREAVADPGRARQADVPGGRAAADAAAGTGRLDGLRRIGIDEKSRGKGPGKYLVIVTDHDAGKVAWVAEGRDQATVRAFSALRRPGRPSTTGPAAPGR